MEHMKERQHSSPLLPPSSFPPFPVCVYVWCVINSGEKRAATKESRWTWGSLTVHQKRRKEGRCFKNRKRGSVYCLLVLPVSEWAQCYSTPPFHHCRKSKQCCSFPFTYFSARPLFVMVDPVRIPFQTLRAHLPPLHLWGQNLCNISNQFYPKAS